MTYEQICKFLLTGYVDNYSCGFLEFDGTENPGKVLRGLCDSPDSFAPGKYFYFFTNNRNKEYDLDEALKISGEKFAAYELPTKVGWYILFKVTE